MNSSITPILRHAVYLSSVTPSRSYPAWLPQWKCSYSSLCEFLIVKAICLGVVWDGKSEETSKISVWPLRIIIVVLKETSKHT